MNFKNYDFSVLTRKLNAMNFSMEKAAIERAIEQQLPRMLENLALIFLCNHNPAWKHWSGELIGNISAFNGKKKKGNKFFSKDSYYSLLWGNTKYANTPNKLYDLLEEKFSKENEILTQEMANHAKKKIQQFMDWLSQELSKGKVEKQDIHDKLYEMINPPENDTINAASK